MVTECGITAVWCCQAKGPAHARMHVCVMDVAMTGNAGFHSNVSNRIVKI